MFDRTRPVRPVSRRSTWGPAAASAWAVVAALAAAGHGTGNATEPPLEGADDNQLPPAQSASALSITPLPLPANAPEARRLIAQLGATTYAARQEAQTRLIAMGPAVRPFCEDARRTALDPQTHASLELVEEGIARAAAERGRAVFVAFDDADAGEAVREIARQAGVDARPDEWTLKGITVNARLAGFSWWEATLDLCDRYGLDVRVSGNATTVVRADNDGPRTLGGPISLDGPLLVLARGATYQRSVDLSATPHKPAGDEAAERLARRGTRFRYDFEAYLEPRFQLGPRRFDVIVTRATDDLGNVLLLAGGAADGHDLGRELTALPAAGNVDAVATTSTVEGQWSAGRLRFEIDLRYPQSPGRRANVAGRIRGLAGAELYDLRATGRELSGGTMWRVADEQVHARLEPAAAAGRWTLTVQSARGISPEVADVMTAALNSAELTDAAGERFRRGPFQANVGDDGRLTVRVEFIGDDDGTMLPTRLACRLPRRAVEIDLPFAFEGLPMP